MYMTKNEIIKRVEWMTKSSVELSQPVLVYNDGFKDGANFVLQNLQQTPCTALREILAPLSNSVQKQLNECKDYIEREHLRRDLRSMEMVLLLMEEIQPVA